ncbi:MAG: competence/damage-inducible protein A [Myxococcota bacterium]|jgi:nicotinamide-nucleotide amidase|nr:competence/damage-inducible protein A [Myxococcota bacterium]
MSGSKTLGSGEVLCAEVITIGDEILRGEIVDSNKALMSERLHDAEVETRFHTSVLDHPAEMADAFRRAVSRADVVLVSGGLGPTRDDLTTEVLADTFGCDLVLDEASLETIRGFFRHLGRDMSDNNAKQAYFPSGAEVLANPVGTAPGFMMEVPFGAEGGDEGAGAGFERVALIFTMPGVPRELALMLEEQVLPRVLARMNHGANNAAGGQGGRAMRARLLRTFGLGESSLDAELQHFARDAGVELGFRTAFPDNYLRPVVRAASAEEADSRLEEACREIRAHLGDVVYGEGDETMAAAVGRLLTEHGATIATAESCTGGLVAEKLTEIPGSSSYVMGGVVAYANEIKTALLGVSEALLKEYGAVSEPVAIAMAEGVRERFDTDFGVSTTGISGPDGGAEEKPVGTVCVALARRGAATHVERFVFPLDRIRHRMLTAQVALDWVRRSLLGVELVGPSLLRRRGGGSMPAGGQK